MNADVPSFRVDRIDSKSQVLLFKPAVSGKPAGNLGVGERRRRIHDNIGSKAFEPIDVEVRAAFTSESPCSGSGEKFSSSVVIVSESKPEIALRHVVSEEAMAFAALLAEQFGLRGLALVRSLLGRLTCRSSRHSDHSKHFHLNERRAWHKHPQRVSVQIGRGELNAGVEQSQQIVADNSFHHVVVAELQPHP